MKRSKEEYEKALDFIRELLSNSSTNNSNNINHQLGNRVPGLKSKDIEVRFNEWADKNEISKAGLRTIQNYLDTFKSQGLPLHTNRIKKHNYYWLGDQQPSFAPDSNTKQRDFDRYYLTRALLKPWKDILPSDLFNDRGQILDHEPLETPPLTLAYPHYQPKPGFSDMVLDFMALIKAGKICRFTYKPGHSSMDDNMSETPDGFAWMKVVWGMPLQINIYMDRVYLLTYSITKADLLERRYTPDSVNKMQLEYKRLSRYVLANVNDFKVEALQDYVQKMEELAPIKEPLAEFQANYTPQSILNDFSIPQIQENIIGVVLPKEEQLHKDADTNYMSNEQGHETSTSPKLPNHSVESIFKPYRLPKPIRRYFGGWAMRYILNSPLHPTQVLKETKLLSEVPPQFIDEENNPIQTFEIGLFEFRIWHTVDFDFRIASFRQFTWDETYGFEGPLEFKAK